MKRIEGIVVSTQIRGKEVKFFVKNQSDTVQFPQYHGKFYELEELDLIGKYFEEDGIFVDIGTNVGNHSIFLAKFLNPKQIITIEANPDAVELIKINVLLNNIVHLVDTSLLGIAVSNKKSAGSIKVNPNNLGGGRVIAAASNAGDGSTVPVEKGDDLLKGRHLDFLKIDVEGMELLALEGLQQVIDETRPKIYVEVDNRNMSSMERWIANNNYKIAEKLKRYPSNENFMLCP